MKILIVEDEAIIADNLEERLINSGYEVIAKIAKGEDVSALVKLNRPDLILMDIKLQGKQDGIETVVQLQKECNNCIPIVYLTSHSDQDTLNRAKLTLPYGYVTKPFTPSELRTTIEVAISKFKNDEERKCINNIIEISIRKLPFEERLQAILENILTLPWISIQGKGCIFILEDERDTVLTMKAHVGLSDEQIQRCNRVMFGECLCGRVALSKEKLQSTCVGDDHDIVFDNMKPHGHYCYPFIRDTKLLGVLNIYVDENYVLETNESGFLDLVVHTLTGVIEHQRMFEELERMACFDCLTSLPNRKLFLEELAYWIKVVKRTKGKFALMFVDMDKFKIVNDTFGHGIGDQLLVAFGQTLKNSVRESDVVSRIGGDEFTIMARVDERDDVMPFISRIYSGLSEPFQLRNEKGEIITVYGDASIGVAIYPDDLPRGVVKEKEVGAMLSIVDELMYQAKEEEGCKFKLLSQPPDGEPME